MYTIGNPNRLGAKLVESEILVMSVDIWHFSWGPAGQSWSDSYEWLGRDGYEGETPELAIAEVEAVLVPNEWVITRPAARRRYFHRNNDGSGYRGETLEMMFSRPNPEPFGFWRSLSGGNLRWVLAKQHHINFGDLSIGMKRSQQIQVEYVPLSR